MLPPSACEKDAGAVTFPISNESLNVTSTGEVMKTNRIEPNSKPTETPPPSRCVAGISKTEYLQQGMLRSFSIAAAIVIVSVLAFHKTQAAEGDLDFKGNGGKAPWEKTAGPPGLEVNVIYKTNNIVYAGTDTQGVYKSTDNGLNWIAANSGIERTSVNDMIASGGNLLVAASSRSSACPSSNNVFKSTDNGVTWSPTSGLSGQIVPFICDKGQLCLRGFLGQFRL